MCNHYRTNPETIPTWREYIGASPYEGEWSDIRIDVWPKYQGMIARGSKVARPHSIAWRGALPWRCRASAKGRQSQSVLRTWRSMIGNPARRCLVPFSTFAEPKPNAGRDEVWFNVTGAPVSALAGIWRPSVEGNVYAFLTCEPNPLVAPIHPKAMPVILHPQDYDRWLNGGDVLDLAAPFPSQLMSAE